MQVIRNQDGMVIRRSRNLAGIRRYVSNHLIKVLAIDALEHGEGKLLILFDDGASFETNFASFQVLKSFVRNWRNVYGALLLINTVDSGKVEYKNVNLA